MYLKFIFLLLYTTLLFADGGYDHGKAAGKNNWDFSLTINPYNYFEWGQSYVIVSYGLNNKIDLHGYFSTSKNGSNYYFGIFYQFVKKERFNLATAIGLRKFTNENTNHMFFPQILYAFDLTKKNQLCGSFVNIINFDNSKILGTAIDVSVKKNLYENNKIKLDFSLGAFNPVIWSPDDMDWYPTYSIDIKFKR